MHYIKSTSIKLLFIYQYFSKKHLYADENHFNFKRFKIETSIVGNKYMFLQDHIFQ
jgi:hypothetical protein